MNGSVAADAGTPIGLLVALALGAWVVYGTVCLASAIKNRKR